VTRQRGSHVRLKKPGRRHALVVPVHKEVKKETLAGILRDAGMSSDWLRGFFSHFELSRPCLLPQRSSKRLLDT
jgi:HicA toxin of bacterial toxin-antitoxin,